MIVVTAVDGSHYTHQVVQTARAFAKGGEVHFVYVAGSYIYPYMVPAGAMIDFEAVRSSQTKAVWDTVGPISGSESTVTLEGAPAATIVDYAKNVKADLIVIGSRGRGAFSALLLGPVSHGVVHAF